MPLARFRTVRGRLLALLLAIALPVTGVAAFSAYTTYRAVVGALEANQIGTADDYAVRTRVWYRGLLRALLAAGGVPRDITEGPGCAGAMAEHLIGIRAVRLVDGAGRVCASSIGSAIGEPALADAVRQLRSRPPVRVWAGQEPAEAHYGHVDIGGRMYLAVAARLPEATPAFQEGLLVVDPELLQQVFDLGSGEGVAALVDRSGLILAVRGGEGAASALPADKRVPSPQLLWRGQSRDGRLLTYAARLVAEPDLFIVVAFENRARDAAQAQLFLLIAVPLLLVALASAALLAGIDRHCLRWLRDVEATARARAQQRSARVPLDGRMPAEILSVAQSFNGMIDDEEVRQRRLQTALDDNLYLVRELHHRVKNSLQVVQSYIGLSKREHSGEARLALADAECRVHVLSAAYRYTLAEGEMQPVRLDLFVEDIVLMVGHLMRRRDQWISTALDSRETLPVERIIPLGFLVVDALAKALRTAPGVTIAVSVRDLDAEQVEIEIRADRPLVLPPPSKMMAGLLMQIGAEDAAAGRPDILGAWRVRHSS